MRPSRIVIEGLRSFRERVEIDFTDRQLFAIVGDTGAGKSSILEAITFALYGSSTWIGQNRPLISDTADDMLVELAFESGGKQYVVRRTASRRPGRTATVELHCVTDNRRVDNAAPVAEEIRRVLGLDREAFLKTVILPQGRFAELLTATPSERDNVLKNIFRVDELEAVRRQASDLHAQLLAPVAGLQAQRQQLPEDPAATLRAAREVERQHRAAAARLAEVAKEAEAQQRAATEAQQHAETARRVAGQLDAEPVAALRGQLEAVGRASAELVAERVGPTEALERARQELATHEEARRAATADGITATALVEARAVLNAVLAALPELAEELHALAGAGAAIEAARERVKPVQQALAEATAGTTAAEQAMAAAREQRAAAAEALAAARLDLAAVRSAAQGVEAARRQVATREAALTRARTERGAASGALAEALRVATERRAELEALERANAAAHAAVGVHAGDACPICQRALPEGFAPPAIPALDDARAGVTSADAALNDARQHDARVEGAVQQANEELEGAREQLTTATSALETALQLLRGRLGSVVDLALEDEALLAPLTATSEAAQAEERAREQAHQAALAAQHAAQRAVDEAEQAVESKRREANQRALGLRQRVQHLERDARGLPRPFAVTLPFVTPAEQTAAEALDPVPVEEQRAAVQERLEALEALEREVAAAQQARDGALEALRALDRREADEVTAPLGRARATAAQLIERLQQAATALGEAGAPVALPLDGDATELAACIEQLEAQRATLEVRVQELATQHERVASDAQEALTRLLAHEEAADPEALRAKLNDATVQAGIAAEHVEVAERQLEAAAALDERLGQSSQLLGDLKTLQALLQNSTFIGELLALRSRALVAAAAQRLNDMTGGRYAFANDFEILDQLTGQPRSARTLSGGESFLASLALALGMVDLAARSGGRLDALFLDEGFGALDTSNASMAIDALEAAAAGGRMVAVISHVAAVAERIDDVLVVVRQPQGSRAAWREGGHDGDLDAEAMTAALNSLLP